MTTAPRSVPLAEPAAEFERQFKWRWWSVIGFLGLMIGLAAVALTSVLMPPRILRGIPDDPDARAAWALVQPGMDAGLIELRFHSEIGVASRLDARVRPDQFARAERAEALLESAARRRSDDPRLHTAIGNLDLVRQRPRHAERAYRAALDLAPHHDEARLGLGVVLARLASLEADPIRRRRLELQALAQFAAVRPHAVEAADARYNRALLLADVGRMGEARRWAGLALAEEPTGPWAERLRRVIGAPANAEPLAPQSVTH